MNVRERIALLPVIAGVSYEVIRFAATPPGLVNVGSSRMPGSVAATHYKRLKPPDDAQAAVAIHALEGAMALEAKQGGELVIA